MAIISKEGRGKRKRKVPRKPTLLSETADPLLRAGPETWTHNMSWKDTKVSHQAWGGIFLLRSYTGVDDDFAGDTSV